MKIKRNPIQNQFVRETDIFEEANSHEIRQNIESSILLLVLYSAGQAIDTIKISHCKVLKFHCLMTYKKTRSHMKISSSPFAARQTTKKQQLSLGQ